jgi:hypothetical protein
MMKNKNYDRSARIYYDNFTHIIFYYLNEINEVSGYFNPV